MNKDLKTFLKGMAFISPWVLGFLMFLALPIALSIYYSVCDYAMLQKPVTIGLSNYKELMGDAVFWKVFWNTMLYAAMALPAGLLVSLGFAIMLNVQIPGQAIFRTIIFLPSLTPAAAGAFVWMFLLSGKLGLVNSMLEKVGIGAVMVLIVVFLCSVAIVIMTIAGGRKPSTASLWALSVLSVLVAAELALEVTGCRYALGAQSVEGPVWFDIKWVLKTFALMSLWGVGNTVVIYLAGLQDVPRELYEAAEIDGASPLRRLWHVTIPMLSPVIFFNLIMAIIGALQNFTGPQLITQGGPDNASRFFSMYVYDFAFTQLKMGYASAMAWLQLLLVLALTALAFWSSKRWVHYQGK